jgi:hypothetical protein
MTHKWGDVENEYEAHYNASTDHCYVDVVIPNLEKNGRYESLYDVQTEDLLLFTSTENGKTLSHDFTAGYPLDTTPNEIEDKIAKLMETER